jgi:protein ImuB
MRRVVSVYLPTWPTDRLRRMRGDKLPWDRPVVMTIQEGSRRIIASVDRAARHLGLRPGMPVAHAQASIVDLAVFEATPEEDWEGLQRLASWCVGFSPLIAPTPPDGIWIEIAGTAHLFGGETALISELVGAIKAGGFAVRASVADTPGAAWAAARFSRETVVVPGGQAAVVAELPVRALRLSPGTVEGLQQLGIERVGQLAAKPRAPLKIRFGDEVIRRLDQAFGQVAEPLAYLPPPGELVVRLAFGEPISAPETLERVTGDLMGTLCRDLEQAGLGARRLDLVFRRIDGERQAIRVGTARPTRDPRHLARLFRERLPLIDPGHGIEEAALAASQAQPLAERQIGAEGLAGPGGPDPDNIGELVDRLSLRLGSTKRVYRVAPFESSMPERTVRRVAPTAPATGLTWPSNLPRPAKLFDPPEAVLAMAEVPDHPPRFFVWRKTRYRIVQADGPERLHGEWWHSEAETSLVRDYYRVQDESGTRYWLFRDAPAAEGGRWWLHGLGEA